ncbi:kelch domain-containing protein 1 isoform X2 [Mauremys reevesii]|uniref:kelch domain-containing protein 1 isoform X2 n=1 Tax=Mauremys reevesii TaxID=260615 RepID=UPI00193EEA71|nr:kelch domain-containing protein 1 isoform X2 [Mauremys reevesii]
MAACAPPSQQFCVAEERSGHCAVVDGNFLYVWGGYVSIEENEVYLPNDELWLYEIDSGLWTMHLMEGELPTSMSGSCGACINGKLYIFGGFDDKGYSNRLYYVNLRTRNGTYRWKKITDFKGQPPTPRDKLSCWVYKDRLIYFGGYGCRKHNELSDCFDVHDAFWEGQIFWGWHNDVHAFDTNTQTWFQPTIRGGVPPQPRAAHTCALLGNKGYIFGGRVLRKLLQSLQKATKKRTTTSSTRELAKKKRSPACLMTSVLARARLNTFESVGSSGIAGTIKAKDPKRVGSERSGRDKPSSSMPVLTEPLRHAAPSRLAPQQFTNPSAEHRAPLALTTTSTRVVQLLMSPCGTTRILFSEGLYSQLVHFIIHLLCDVMINMLCHI